MPEYDLWNQKVTLDIDEGAMEGVQKHCAAIEACLPNGQHGWFESVYNKSQLHYRFFLPNDNKIKGVIVFHHGIQGHSGRAIGGLCVNTQLQAEIFTQQGYALYMLDALGHGFSEGTRFFVPDYKVNRDDFSRFGRYVAQKHNVPLILAGESYGSCLCLHVAKLWQDAPDQAPPKFVGIAVIAPAIVGNLPPKPVVWTLRYGLAPLFPKWVPFFMPNPVSAENIWSVESVRNSYKNSSYVEAGVEGGGRPFRLGTAVQMLNALEDARQHVIPHLKVPFCACHGTSDRAVPIASLDFLEQHAATPHSERAVLRQECFHDMLAEPTNRETMDFILDFVNKRVQTVRS